ncbi:MAG: hypothetical protein EBX40_07040 [Gammaproteobacteria bacterium]|nr:hypothetical protein [Gammaproteobacteria bacterium]
MGNKENIQSAIAFMLNRHDALIITGGLGPTSDDLTRFALADELNLPLDHSEDSWKRLSRRLEVRNIVVTPNNRQQALFPKGAIIFPNQFGTADGCLITHQQKLIFLLPGPPRECMPMFEEGVWPHLESHQFFSDQRLFRWRLMGIGESTMATKIEPLAQRFGFEFGYRAAYPYLDIKILLNSEQDVEAICNAVYEKVSPYLVTTENANISTQLKHALVHFDGELHICDFATRGALASELTTPANQHTLVFYSSENLLPGHYTVIIHGLEEYWSPQPDTHITRIQVALIEQGIEVNFEHEIYLRGTETIEFAIEFVCHQIYKRWFKS